MTRSQGQGFVGKNKFNPLTETRLFFMFLYDIHSIPDSLVKLVIPSQELIFYFDVFNQALFCLLIIFVKSGYSLSFKETLLIFVDVP